MSSKKSRFNVSPFFVALDAERQLRCVNWTQVAKEANISKSSLTRISQGKKPDLDTVAALSSWSGIKLDPYIIPLTSQGKKPYEPSSALERIAIFLESTLGINYPSTKTLEPDLSTEDSTTESQHNQYPITTDYE